MRGGGIKIASGRQLTFPGMAVSVKLRPQRMGTKRMISKVDVMEVVLHAHIQNNVHNRYC